MNTFPRTPIERTQHKEYRIATSHYTGLNEQEARKIVSGATQFNIWKLLPFILLVLFAIGTVIYLANGG